VNIIKWNIWNKKERIITLFFFAVALFYLLSRIQFGINLYDEGIALYGAVRVLEGYIPYRDFYYLYPPGNLYVLALLFKGFGPSIIIARIFNSIILFLILVCSYFITKNVVSDKISLFISFFLITLWLGMDGSYNYIALTMLFMLLSSIFIFKYFDKRILHNLIIAGVLTGITAYFRWDFSLYLFFSISITSMIFNYNHYSDLGHKRVLSLIKSTKKLSIFWTVSILTIIPLVIFLLYYVPIDQLISQFITYPTQIYPEYRSLPWSYAYFDLIPTTIFIYSCVIVWIIYKLIKDKIGSKKDFKVIFLIFLGLSLIYYAKVRPEPVHFFPAMIIAIILFAYISSEIIKINNLIQPKIAIKNPKSTILKFLVVYLIIGLFILHSAPILDNDNLTPLNLERGNGIYVSQQDDDFIAAVRYIQLNVPSNEKIFVGNSNDTTVFNNVMFYFLAGRDSGVFYYDLEPGVVTTHSVQLEMINQLEQNNVHYIILWNGMENYIEPNRSNQSSGVKDLDDFIRSHYQLTKTFGNYTIYTMKN